MNAAVCELKEGDLKRCPKCREPQSLALFYTKGLDRKGRVRHDTHCIKHKLQHIRQKSRRLHLLKTTKQPRPITARIDIKNYNFNEVANTPGEYLPSQLQASLSSMVYEAIFKSPPSHSSEIGGIDADRQESP